MNLKRYPNLPGSPASVTSILKAVFPRPALHQWEIEETAKLARKYPREAIKGILYRHDTGAAARGTRVHKAIECELTGLPIPILTDAEIDIHGQWAGWWESAKLEVVASEQVVWSPTNHYAGTVDLMAIDSATGERVIVDWKTCARCPTEPWFDNVVQVAAYMMAEKMDDVPAPVTALGLLVYIAPDGVKAFDIQGKLLSRARQAWFGTLDVAKALYPEILGA